MAKRYKYSVTGNRGGKYLTETLAEAKKIAGKHGTVRELTRHYKYSVRGPRGGEYLCSTLREAKKLAGKTGSVRKLRSATPRAGGRTKRKSKRNPRAIKGYVEQDSVDGTWGFTVEDPIAKDRYQLQIGGWSSETAAQGALDDFIQGSGIYPSQTLRQYAKIFLAHEKTHGWRIGRRRNPQMLITKAIARRLPALYATENIKDPVVHLKLFNAFGGGTWLITEYDPKQDLAFGFTAGLGGQGDDDLGYISIAELRKLRKWGAPRIERDRWFRPAPLSIAKAREAYLRGEGPKPAEKKPRKPAPKRATKRRTKAVPKLKTKAPKGTQGALFANPKRNPVNVPMVRSIAKDIGRTYGTRFSVRKGHGQTLGLVEVRDGRDESPANAQIALLKALKADGYEATGGGMTLAEKIRQIQQYGAVALSLELTHRPTIPDDVLHLWDDEIT